ncbi:hypothetical protein [Thalassiella azotivora]
MVAQRDEVTSGPAEASGPVRDAAGRGRRRPRWTTRALLPAVAVVVAAAVVSAVLFLREGAPDAGPGAAPPPSVSPVTPSVDPALDRRQALDVLLGVRSGAALSGDAAAWLGTVDPQAEDYATRQGEVIDRLGRLPLTSWSYEQAGQGPALSAARRTELAADDAWVARVVLAYALAGGGGQVRREQNLTVVRRGDAWFLAGDRDGPTAVDLWDLGPVQVARGGRSLVLGTAGQDVLDRYAGEVDEAAERVDAVWGTGWPRTVVVMVPRDSAEMAALLGRQDAAGLDQIAAVTTGEIGLDSVATSADRVIVNPDGFAELGPLGRDVVLVHEITHVATRATTTASVPIWLSEGLADYVAYAGTDLGPDDVAADLLAQVRDGQGPARLPGPAEFDPANGQIAAAYSGSWLAVRLVADRAGQDGVLALYREVAGAQGGTARSTPGATPASQAVVDAALQRRLGVDEAGFTDLWLSELDRLAGDGT